MDELEQLREQYRQYHNQVQKVRLDAKPFAGVFGIGAGPKDDPCHMAFFHGVEETCKGFADAPVSADTAAAVIRYVVTAQTEGEKEGITYWPMMAAHGTILPLIPLITKEQASELKALYEQTVPKRERMPLQDKVLKALAERAGENNKTGFRLFGGFGRK